MQFVIRRWQFELFWLYSTLDLKWNKEHAVSFTEDMTDAKIPPKSSGNKNGFIAEENMI